MEEALSYRSSMGEDGYSLLRVIEEVLDYQAVGENSAFKVFTRPEV